MDDRAVYDACDLERVAGSEGGPLAMLFAAGGVSHLVICGSYTHSSVPAAALDQADNG